MFEMARDATLTSSSPSFEVVGAYFSPVNDVRRSHRLYMVRHA
jgi:hypothetical protein